MMIATDDERCVHQTANRIDAIGLLTAGPRDRRRRSCPRGSRRRWCGGVGWVGGGGVLRCARTRFLWVRRDVRRRRAHTSMRRVRERAMGGAGSGDCGRGGHPASCNRRFPTTAAVAVFDDVVASTAAAAHQRRSSSLIADARGHPRPPLSLRTPTQTARPSRLRGCLRRADKPRVRFQFFRS